MAEEIPSTAFVEEMYVQGCKNEKGDHHSFPVESRPEFQRWLASHDAAVRADQIEKDADIALGEVVPTTYSISGDIAAAIRAQLEGTSDE